MAQTTIRFDNKDLEEIRKFAKDNGLQIKRLMVSAIKVGTQDPEKLMDAYRAYGNSK